MWHKIFAGILITVGIIFAYLLFWPIPINPSQWNPPEAPTLTGVYEPNDRLASVERLETGGFGPEDVAFDDLGRIYTGLEDGRIMRLQNGGPPQVFAYTGGCPLGLCFTLSGDLIVADADKGLLSISRNGSIRVLSTEAEGVPFKLTDGVDIAKDGTIYFSDASSKFSNKDYMYDLMENQPNGRLLAYYLSITQPKSCFMPSTLLMALQLALTSILSWLPKRTGIKYFAIGYMARIRAEVIFSYRICQDFQMGYQAMVTILSGWL